MLRFFPNFSMFFRRRKRFAEFLSWECFGRSLAMGLLAAGAFAVALWFGPPADRADVFVAAVAVTASLLDAGARHRRFFTDFFLIRELEASHRRGDFRSLLEADLMIWNNQYAMHFLAGLLGAWIAADAMTAGGINEMGIFRAAFLFGAAFYLSNAVIWRVKAHNRVMLFLRNLKVDYAEQLHG